jgi:hypothetical protein
MATSIGAAARRIKQELDQWVNQTMVEDACRKAGYRWRKRKLDPLLRVHLMLLQRLAQVALAGLRHVAKVQASAQAICQARQRLPLSVLLELLQASCRSGCANVKEVPLWRGLRTWLVDGFSTLAPDTAALDKRYGKGSNQHGRSDGYPLPKLLAMVDWASGLVLRAVALPHARNEKSCLSRLLSHLGNGDLALADRGLVSFAHVALMLRAGVHCCIRLPQSMVVIGWGKGSHRLIRRLGAGDLLVRWIKPPAKPNWMKRSEWDALPQQMILRQVSRRIRRRGFRDQWLRVITTLLDPDAYPAQELLDLYARRWQVEVYFRDLKCTLGMKQLSCRSVAGVRKEIVCFLLLYNLVRQVMIRAAAAQGVTPDRISFTDTICWLLWSDPDEPMPKLAVVPRRSRASEPRVLKHGRRKYPMMNGSREQLRNRLQGRN